MRTLSKSTLIFSAYLGIRTPGQNFEEHQNLKNWLRVMNIPFRELQGKYKGAEELSIQVSSDHRRVAEMVLRDYTQESYLELYYDGFAELVFQDGGREKLGYLKQVTKAEADKLDAYSYDAETDTYYAVVRS